jgi:dTDP-glucose 4,6-dehydratase
MTILVTGGAGFIGSNFILDWLAQSDETLVNIDKLTYAGNLASLQSRIDDERHVFVEGDICDGGLVTRLLEAHRPRAVIHFAAESHVDRSIAGPAPFIDTNIRGTFELLEASRRYFDGGAGRGTSFRFLHVSTDEVYGSLGEAEPPSRETSPYTPRSPYSASKAASDHLVAAYHHTFGLPTLVTNCSNNYGPRQNPEKLIPLAIGSALAGRPIPVYGAGQNIRDWLYVGDHCTAIRTVLAEGEVGETYNVGGGNQMRNIDVVREICAILDETRPRPEGGSHADLITFVQDRPGHDFRYALDTTKIATTLGWSPREDFTSGLRKTVAWYLDNQDWVESCRQKARMGEAA